MAVFGIPTTSKEVVASNQQRAAQNPNALSFTNIGAGVTKAMQGAGQAAGALSGAVADPYGLNALMNSDAYKGYANNTQQYDAAYQNAVNASRSNITQALGAAMTELNNRQNSINAAGAAAPGQIDASYGRANDAINANTGAVTGIMGQAQVDPSIGPSMAAANAPVLAALQGNQAEAQAGVQPVVSGLGAEISKERASTQMDAADKLASLDMSAADHASSSAQAAAEPSWMQKMMIQNQMDSAQARLANNAKAQTAAAKQASDLQTLDAKAGNRVSASAGKTYANNKLSANYVNQVESGGAGRASKAYADATQSLAAARDASAKAGNDHAFKQAMKRIQHTYPKQHVPISIAVYRLGITDKQLHALGY